MTATGEQRGVSGDQPGPQHSPVQDQTRRLSAYSHLNPSQGTSFLCSFPSILFSLHPEADTRILSLDQTCEVRVLPQPSYLSHTFHGHPVQQVPLLSSPAQGTSPLPKSTTQLTSSHQPPGTTGFPCSCAISSPPKLIHCPVEGAQSLPGFNYHFLRHFFPWMPSSAPQHLGGHIYRQALAEVNYYFSRSSGSFPQWSLMEGSEQCDTCRGATQPAATLKHL